MYLHVLVEWCVILPVAFRCVVVHHTRLSVIQTSGYRLVGWRLYSWSNISTSTSTSTFNINSIFHPPYIGAVVSAYLIRQGHTSVAATRKLLRRQRARALPSATHAAQLEWYQKHAGDISEAVVSAQEAIRHQLAALSSRLDALLQQVNQAGE